MLSLFGSKEKQSTKILEFLDQLESYIMRDSRTIMIDTSHTFDSNMQKIVDKITHIAQTLEEQTSHSHKVNDEILHVLEKISNGDLSSRVNPNIQEKTLCQTADTINDMSEKLQRDFIDMVSVLKEYEQGIYIKSLDQSRMKEGDIKDLIQGINLLKNSITTMLGENFKHGIELKNSSQLLITKMLDILEASEQQSNILQDASLEVETIIEKSSKSRDNTKTMQSSSLKVKNSVSQGLEYANKTVIAMEEINQATIAITEAIDVIDQISFQTNILSLNAAVEAATAGEAGKGFAVVASEVRNLAARSADAAKTIKELVSTATEKSNEGKSISSSMIKGYQELHEDIDGTIILIEDTVSFSKEQSSSIQSLEKTIDLLNQHTKDYVSIAHSANEVSASVNELSTTISRIADVTEFDGKAHILQETQNKKRISHV